MLVSYRNNFLFVHVPKTGGTSVRHALRKYRHNPDIFRINQTLACFGIEVNHFSRDFRKLKFRAHERADRIADVMPDEIFQRLFKFAFVRNPWDLIASLYKFIRKTPSHKRHRLVNRMSFPEFIDFALFKQLCHQKRLLTDQNGNLLVDFVGRFENLESDFAQVARQLQLDAKIPHLNQTNPSAYQDFYDENLRAKVSSAYRDDIEQFQYEFSRAA